jgi:hypothetical protein
MICQPNGHDIERRDGEPSDASADHTQERLWAACLAEHPAIMSDIVTFIQGARIRLMQSPPRSPVDTMRSDRASDDA